MTRLEQVQQQLVQAGYAAARIGSGASSVMLNVWHPDNPDRTIDVHLTIHDQHETYLWSTPRNGGSVHSYERLDRKSTV